MWLAALQKEQERAQAERSLVLQAGYYQVISGTLTGRQIMKEWRRALKETLGDRSAGDWSLCKIYYLPCVENVIISYLSKVLLSGKGVAAG